MGYFQFYRLVQLRALVCEEGGFGDCGIVSRESSKGIEQDRLVDHTHLFDKSEKTAKKCNPKSEKGYKKGTASNKSRE